MYQTKRMPFFSGEETALLASQKSFTSQFSFVVVVFFFLAQPNDQKLLIK
jgi:hypothetical protein